MILPIIFIAIVLLVPAIAYAAPDIIQDPGGFLGALSGAVHTSNWKLAAAMVLMGLVVLARVYGSKLFPSLGTGKGAFILALAMGSLGSIVLGLEAGTLTSGVALIKALYDGAMTALVASGAYSGIKKLSEKKA